MNVGRFWIRVALLFLAVALLSATLWPLPVVGTSPGWSFSGDVYQGAPPDMSTPFRAVEVTLYGSNDPGVWGTLLDQTLTNTSGAFSLSTEAQREYYHIVETQPSGYYSTGAQAGTGGTKVDSDWIRYKTPSQGSYAGHRSWTDQYLSANRSEA